MVDTPRSPFRRALPVASSTRQTIWIPSKGETVRRSHLYLTPVLLVISLALSSCDSKRRAAAQSDTTTPQARVIEDRKAPGEASMSREMRADFGAAAWVPEDAAFFCSMSRLREQWDAIAKSRAVARILELPTVQMALAQARQRPAWRQFEYQRQGNPFVRSIVDLAADAFSSEIFVYADSHWVEVIDTIAEIYWRGNLLAISDALDDRVRLGSGDGRERPMRIRRRAFIAACAESAENLRVPPVVLGFRLSAPGPARTTLSALMTNLRKFVPAEIAQETIGGGKYYTARFDGSALPRAFIAERSSELLKAGATLEAVDKLMRLLRSQTLAVSVGLRGDYLLLALGPDTEHLKRLGTGRSLAESRALAPVRQKFKPRMISLSYVDERLCVFGGKLDADDVEAGLNELLQSFPAGVVPDGLPRRLRRDARGLIADLNQSLPEPLPMVAASFLNRGVESYSFLAHAPGSWDSTKRLSILSLAGAKPLFACAFRSAPVGSSCERVGHWAEVAYGYFKDFILERLDPSERVHVSEFESVFLVALKNLWSTTLDDLIPAMNGGEGLFVADGNGVLQKLPGDTVPLQRPVAFPRPALVMEVQDADRLKLAFSRFRAIVNEMLRRQADLVGSLDSLEIPAPRSRPHAGGVLYTYPLPEDLTDLGIEPHVLVTDRYVVVSLFAAQSESLVKTAASPSSQIIRLDAPSGAAFTIDFEPILTMIFQDVRVALNRAVDSGQTDPRSASLIWMHLPVLEQVLGTLKSYSGRIYREGALTVRHSWLHVEDLADG